MIVGSNGGFLKKAAAPIPQSGKILVISNGTQNAAYSSDNGVTFTAGTQQQDNGGGSTVIAANANIFVWLANGATRSTAQYTTDGINFHTTNMPSNANWTCICYGGTQFVSGMEAAISGGGIATSPDGIVWTQRDLGSPGTRLVAIVYNGSVYCALDNNNNSFISSTGFTWTQYTMVGFGSYIPTSIVWNGSVFIAAAEHAGSVSPFTSPDGITWTKRTASVHSGEGYLAWSKSLGLAVLVSTESGASYVDTSPDGVTWTQRTFSYPNATSFNGICWNGTAFVVANDDASTGLRSTDGITWTQTGSMGTVMWTVAAQFLNYGTY